MHKRVENYQVALDIYAWLVSNVGPMGKIAADAVHGQGWIVTLVGRDDGALWNIDFDYEADEIMFALRWS